MYEALIAQLDAIAAEPEPTDGMAASIRASFPVGTIEVTGSRLTFYDSWGHPSDGVSVKIPRGTYQLTAEIHFYGNEARVARLRAHLLGTEPSRGTRVGSFGVDVGTAAVCDGEVLKRFALEDSRRWGDWSEDFIEYQTAEDDLLGLYTSEVPKTDIFYCSTGFGDGHYPVFRLTHDGKVVGAEAQFLLPKQTYIGQEPAAKDDA
jgi:Protein of unknown function (DUF4241)